MILLKQFNLTNHTCQVKHVFYVGYLSKAVLHNCTEGGQIFLVNAYWRMTEMSSMSSTSLPLHYLLFLSKLAFLCAGNSACHKINTGENIPSTMIDCFLFVFEGLYCFLLVFKESGAERHENPLLFQS